MYDPLQLQAAPALLNPTTAAQKASLQPYLYAGQSSLAVPTSISRRFVITLSQPLMQKNGLLKWSLNNVVSPTSGPQCSALLMVSE